MDEEAGEIEREREGEEKEEKKRRGGGDGERKEAGSIYTFITFFSLSYLCS